MKKLHYILYIIFTIFAFVPAIPVHAEEVAADTPPPLAIRALNPGYTVEDKANTNEFIELYRTDSSTEPLSLTGISLYYTNGNNNRNKLLDFPNGSQMTGKTLLLRLNSSPGADASDLTYKTTLAVKAGPLEIVYQGNVIDSVCWTGTKPCYADFKNAEPTTLVRNLSLNTFEHTTFYTPAYDAEHPSYLAPAVPEATPTETIITEPACRGLEFSELLSYYDADASEQFIELYNGTDEPINTAGCTLRYKKKTYPLSGTIAASEYYVYNPVDFTLTKNPTSTNLIELLDTTGEVLDSVEYPHGQKKTAAYAAFGTREGKQWQITYQPTPGAPNVYQEFRSCPAGKVINEATGNCIKSSTLSTTATECPEGKYRNPLTGRCKSYDTDSTTTECKTGYERNPETNRCRKIKENTGADYALVPETYTETSNFVALGFIILLIAIGAGYVIFQFRKEILGIFRKLLYNIKHEASRHRTKTSHRNRGYHHSGDPGTNSSQKS